MRWCAAVFVYSNWCVAPHITLKSENARLREKLICSEIKVTFSETSGSGEQNLLKGNVVSVFSNIGVNVTSNDMEACHRIRKSRVI